MPRFGKRSLENLAMAHDDLQQWLFELIKHFGVTVVESYRDDKQQNLYYQQGKSYAKAGQSAHNYLKSYAVDIIPDEGLWLAKPAKFLEMAAIGLHIAKSARLDLSWGGLYTVKKKGKFKHFADLAHFEIKNWRELEGGNDA